MTTLSADRRVPAHKQVVDGAYFIDFPVAASTVIYAGGFVGLNAAGDLVMLIPQAIATAQQVAKFVGVAQEHIASQASAGDATCKVLVEGYYQSDLTSATKADVGKSVYATDDNVIAVEGLSSNDVVGTIVHLESAAVVILKLPIFGTRPGLKTIIFNDATGILVNVRLSLLHETENHNGAYVVDIASVNKAAIDGDATDCVWTITHTRATDTTTAVTLTLLDNAPDEDLTVSVAVGKLYGVGTATADNMIVIPADVSACLKCTTAATDASPPGLATADIVVTLAIL